MVANIIIDCYGFGHYFFKLLSGTNVLRIQKLNYPVKNKANPHFK